MHLNRYLIALVLALSALTIALPARAAESVTLDLRAQVGDVPTHLCVVSEARGPRTRQVLWDILESNPETRGNGHAWRVKPETWGATAPPERQVCGRDPVVDCRPQVELPSAMGRGNDLFVACAADSLISEASTMDDPRLLVVLLEHLGAAPPAIDSVRLAGGIATIGVLSRPSSATVTARSLGGNYVPHVRSFPEAERGSHLISLELSPRCHDFEVLLPDTSLAPGDIDRLRVRAHGAQMDVERCVDDLGGGEVLMVRLPRAPAKRGRLEIELQAAGGDGPPAARFGGAWTGPWPRAPFQLKLHQLSFRWRRPKCIYPEDACPSATLETGTICAVQSTPEACEYRCPGEVDDAGTLALELPLDVTFEKQNPRQRWTDKLARKGQTLGRYVSPDQIRLRANVYKWRTEDPGNRIKRVDVFLNDGTTQKYGVAHQPNLLVEMPLKGATCEPVRFQPVGDRRYDEGLATVKNGELDFGKPERRARVASFTVGLAAGGGPAWSTAPSSGTEEGPPVYFSGLLQFGASLRPRKPKLNRLTVEPRLLATIGQWGFVKGIDDPASEADFKGLPWARLLFETGLGYDVVHRFALGLGGGIGASWPVNRPEELRGNSFTFIGSAVLEGRVELRRHVSFLLQLRGIFGEKEIKVTEAADNAPDSMDTTEQKDFSSYSLITFLGVLLDF